MTNGNIQQYDQSTAVVFKVVNVTESTGQDSTGRFVSGKQVTYQLKSGLSGTVFIPDASFNEDTVRAALQKAAATLQNVSMISQGM